MYSLLLSIMLICSYLLPSFIFGTQRQCWVSIEYLWDLTTDFHSSIDRIEDSAIFLKPERVVLREGEILIQNEEGDEYSLHSLSYTDEIDTPRAQLIKNKDLIKVWICTNPHCQKAHYYKPQKCESCGITTFIVRYFPKK